MSSPAFSDTTTGKVFNLVVGREKKKHSHGDPSREVFETVVFVVVLVLMLKLFVAEAFVIPTGSMASTLWGDQIKVTCPDCGQDFAVTAAASHGAPRTVPSQTFCQNCGLAFSPENPSDWNSGDRVLVGKYAYHIADPKRFDVPVFKYPEQPYHPYEKTAMNYIKRLVGLPGETIAIHHGDLYRTKALTYEGRPVPARPEDAWKLDYTYSNDSEAVSLFEKGGFEPVRKSPNEILAVRRLVFDLDRQPKALKDAARTRWHPSPEAGAGWVMNDKGFTHSGGEFGWVRYHHVEPGSWRLDAGRATTPRQPAFVLDYLAYNVSNGANFKNETHAHFWVPDLMAECTAKFDGAGDKLTMELTKGTDKFHAVFADGKCQLIHLTAAAPDKPVVMGEQPTKITSGKHDLRFANMDSRLTVWVDGKALPFGPAADYVPVISEKSEPTSADLEPARIGAVGSVEVTEVKVWRDVYYTCNSATTDAEGRHQCGVQTYYVQPGHYFCLGDNSAASADGRSWGLVPERLMLGRAVVVYWPLSRIGVIK